MKIGLIDVDGHNFPNFALMKISAWHKQNGDSVEWYDPLFCKVDRIYASKVFTFTEPYPYFPNDCEIIKGGTGYDFTVRLPEEIEKTAPDYSIYPQYGFAMGFLSRGCIRNCPWCIVPKKEGKIRPVDDIERIHRESGRRHIVLMDNNFLACPAEFVREQLTKARKLKLLLDFNQALDARLVTEGNAALLAKCKWRNTSGKSSYIRFSCDTSAVINAVKSAIRLIRKAGYTGKFFIYFLAKEVKETLHRIMEILNFDRGVSPFVMPWRDLAGNGEIKDDNLKRLANWCNKAAVRASCRFENFKG